MSAEEWRPIPGFPDYDASDQGRIRSRRKPNELRILSPWRDRHGYAVVRIYAAPGKRICKSVHRLVALAFLGEPPAGHVTRHLNGDKTDNRLANIAFGTQSENVYDAVRHGTHRMARRTTCPKGHPYDVLEIERVSGKRRRRCSTCLKARNRARHLRLKGEAA